MATVAYDVVGTVQLSSILGLVPPWRVAAQSEAVRVREDFRSRGLGTRDVQVSDRRGTAPRLRPGPGDHR